MDPQRGPRSGIPPPPGLMLRPLWVPEQWQSVSRPKPKPKRVSALLGSVVVYEEGGKLCFASQITKMSQQIEQPQMINEICDIDYNQEILVVLDSTGLLTLVKHQIIEPDKPLFHILYQVKTPYDQVVLCKSSNLLICASETHTVTCYPDVIRNPDTHTSIPINAAVVVPNADNKLMLAIAESSYTFPRLLIAATGTTPRPTLEPIIYVNAGQEPLIAMEYLRSIDSVLMVASSGLGLISCSSDAECGLKCEVPPDTLVCDYSVMGLVLLVSSTQINWVGYTHGLQMLNQRPVSIPQPFLAAALNGPVLSCYCGLLNGVFTFNFGPDPSPGSLPAPSEHASDPLSAGPFSAPSSLPSSYPYPSPAPAPAPAPFPSPSSIPPQAPLPSSQLEPASQSQSQPLAQPQSAPRPQPQPDELKETEQNPTTQASSKVSTSSPLSLPLSLPLPSPAAMGVANTTTERGPEAEVPQIAANTASPEVKVSVPVPVPVPVPALPVIPVTVREQQAPTSHEEEGPQADTGKRENKQGNPTQLVDQPNVEKPVQPHPENKHQQGIISLLEEAQVEKSGDVQRAKIEVQTRNAEEQKRSDSMGETAEGKTKGKIPEKAKVHVILPLREPDQDKAEPKAASVAAIPARSQGSVDRHPGTGDNQAELEEAFEDLMPQIDKEALQQDEEKHAAEAKPESPVQPPPSQTRPPVFEPEPVLPFALFQELETGTPPRAELSPAEEQDVDRRVDDKQSQEQQQEKRAQVREPARESPKQGQSAQARQKDNARSGKKKTHQGKDEEKKKGKNEEKKKRKGEEKKKRKGETKKEFNQKVSDKSRCNEQDQAQLNDIAMNEEDKGRETDSQAVQTDEELVVAQFKELGVKVQEAITGRLNSRLEAIEKQLAAEIGSHLELRLKQLVESAVGQQMETLKREVETKLRQCVGESLAALQIDKQISSIHESVQRQLSYLLQNVFIPAFEGTCNLMFKDLAKVHHDGIAAFRQKLSLESAAISTLKEREEAALTRHSTLASKMQEVLNQQLVTLGKTEALTQARIEELERARPQPELLKEEEKASHAPAPVPVPAPASASASAPVSAPAPIPVPVSVSGPVPVAMPIPISTMASAPNLRVQPAILSTPKVATPVESKHINELFAAVEESSPVAATEVAGRPSPAQATIREPAQKGVAAQQPGQAQGTMPRPQGQVETGQMLFDQALASRNLPEAARIAVAESLGEKSFLMILNTFDVQLLQAAASYGHLNQRFVRHSLYGIISYLVAHTDTVTKQLVELLEKSQVTLWRPSDRAEYAEYETVANMLYEFLTWARKLS